MQEKVKLSADVQEKWFTESKKQPAYVCLNSDTAGGFLSLLF